jgi:hypothetical protein
MKAKDIILIALLCVNFALAGVAGALAMARAEPSARAEAVARAGDYIMVTGHIANTREALLVIDTVAQRANFYVPAAGATAGGRRWELTATRSLALDFAK